MFRILVHTNIYEVRFMLSLFLTFLYCYIQRPQSKYNAGFALLVGYLAFGYKQLLYVIFSIVLNLFLLKIFRFNEYQFALINFIILYLFKIFGRSIEPFIAGSFDISGVLMLMTIKMSYLGKEYNDKYTISDAISYLTFLPGFFMGPATNFVTFIKRPYVKHKFPTETFIKSLMLLLVYQALRNNFTRNLLFEQHGPVNLLNLYLWNLGNRVKFYFVWYFSHGCLVMCNFTDSLNVKVTKIELANSIKDLSQGWNIFTNTWLKNVFFLKLKPKSIFWASIATFAVSALWHGIHPCYLFMFISFGCFIPIIKQNNVMFGRFTLLSKLQMMLFIAYFSAPFFLLNVMDTYYVWKNVWFIGHLFIFVSSVLQLACKLVNKSAKNK